MKKHQNFILFIIVLVLSYLSASYVGDWYDQIDPQYGSLFFDSSDSKIVYGFLLSYVFFVPFIFEAFTKEKKNRWMIILLAPVVLFYLYANASLIYLLMGIAISGCLIAKLIRIIISSILKSR